MTGRPHWTALAAGFTLLEVVITLVIAGFLGTLLIQLVSTGVTRSAEPVVAVQTGYRLMGIMDRITADYEKSYRTGAGSVAAFGAFKSDLEGGNQEGATPYYGDYTIDTGYITFDAGGDEVADTGADPLLLRVRITVAGQSVCAVFAR